MRFAQSTLVRETVSKSKHILLNVHRNPDLDSVGSALALQMVLMDMGKQVDVAGPHKVNPDYLFLPGVDKIKLIDYKMYDFTPYDLLIILDSGSSQIVTGDPEIPLPHLPCIVIDHHKNNNIEAQIKLIDDHASSTAEILYHLFEDWNVMVTPEIATMLFAGACHDTMFFKYNENEVDTFQVAAHLIAKGADKNLILNHVFNSLELSYVKYVGKMLERIRYENTTSSNSGFVWIALEYEGYKEMGSPISLREYVADNFIQSVKDSPFGVVMVEEQKGKLCISFRGKEKSNMSAIAQRLGGGGHKLRAGATLYGKDFNEMVEKVLSTLKS